MTTVFIDGQEGTTGLQIHERLKGRSDLTLLTIEPERRKDPTRRRELIESADFLITCLPDAAARESIAMVGSARTRVIDPSTAHRTAPGWVYGFPELDREHREKVKTATRVAVPGCHATGFVAALRPLVARGVLAPDYPVVAFSLTGYSGGGRKMIEEFESATAGARERLSAPQPYALGLSHKHLPEMQHVVGLSRTPLFEPVVSNFYQGMLVSVPLHVSALARRVTLSDVHALLAEHYEGERFVRVMPLAPDGSPEGGRLTPVACNGTNRLELFVCGNDEQILLVARLDNLGKGASGAAVQNLNLMLGCDEGTGLEA